MTERWRYSGGAHGRIPAPVHRLLEAITSRVSGFPARMGILLGVAFAFVLAGTWAFAALADDVLEGETERFDQTVLTWLAGHASPQLDSLALEITTLADTTVIAVILLVASGLLWASRHRFSVLMLWVAVAGSGVLVYFLKLGFDRPRPDQAGWRANYVVESASFPSGHALGAMVAYATVAYLISRLQAGWRLRWLTYVLATLLIALIGLTRMYLGVHYPSDVVAGFSLGLAWTAACALGIEALSYFRTGTSRWLVEEPPPPDTSA